MIWALLEPEKLSEEARSILANQEAQIWISPITSWECCLLMERGRVSLLPDARQWLAQAFLLTAAKEAALTHEVALLSRTVQIPHQDPADRFLAATAAVYNLTLLTADEKLLRGSGFLVQKAD